jgi:anti-sigma factor RsiW
MTEIELPEMPCRELVELVTEYLEGTLSADDRVRFEAHLDDCEYCATYVEQMRTTIRLVGRIPSESVDSEAMQALRAAFRGWHDGL